MRAAGAVPLSRKVVERLMILTDLHSTLSLNAQMDDNPKYLEKLPSPNPNFFLWSLQNLGFGYAYGITPSSYFNSSVLQGSKDFEPSTAAAQISTFSREARSWVLVSVHFALNSLWIKGINIFGSKDTPHAAQRGRNSHVLFLEGISLLCANVQWLPIGRAGELCPLRGLEWDQPLGWESFAPPWVEGDYFLHG